jgi:hypothetical protein
VAKDRARPFSRKHRKYWFTVTGGMLLIGAINVALGMCAYEEPGGPPERIVPVLPSTDAPAAPGAIGLGEVPVPVIKSFALAFPRNAPRAARKLVGADGSLIQN